jgi:hypothetical protein
MLEFAKKKEDELKVWRTQTSPVDSLAGAIGEIAFAKWFYGDWKKNEIGANKGRTDFEDLIEVKASVFPLSNKLNLPIREDYAKARCPALYVWCCIDIPTRHHKEIQPGLYVAIVGWTTGMKANSAPLGFMGWVRSYRCHLTPVPELEIMETFAKAVEDARRGGADSMESNAPRS